jgi:predicted site-specific integrase-resolvase
MDEKRRQELLNKEELSTGEAAELWGVDYKLVWRYIKEGLLEGRNIAPKGLVYSRWVVKTSSLKERMGIGDQVTAQ